MKDPAQFLQNEINRLKVFVERNSIFDAGQTYAEFNGYLEGLNNAGILSSPERKEWIGIANEVIKPITGI